MRSVDLINLSNIGLDLVSLTRKLFPKTMKLKLNNSLIRLKCCDQIWKCNSKWSVSFNDAHFFQMPRVKERTTSRNRVPDDVMRAAIKTILDDKIPIRIAAEKNQRSGS